MALLEVDNLRTHFRVRDGVVKAVDGVSFSVDNGRDAGDRRRVGVREDRLLSHGDGPARFEQQRGERNGSLQG